MIVRLKEQWAEEYEQWIKRSLIGKHDVGIWADGIYAKVRLEDDANNKQCMLVLMGATADGKKELIAVLDGYRERKQSWRELLLDLKNRGLEEAPKLAVGDGNLLSATVPSDSGPALREIFPETREQRCWVHKTANVLNKMPRSVQPKAKSDLHEIWQAETKKQPNQALDQFLRSTRPSTPRRANVSPKIVVSPKAVNRCSRSPTSRPSTGGT